MKKFWTLPALLFFLVLGAKFMGVKYSHAKTFDEIPSKVVLEVNEDAIIKNVNRIGINLGQWTSWGSQQYSENVLMNPGFEGQIDRAIVVITQVEEENFSGEVGWGYPDDYWNEAEYDIRTGDSAGKRGVIKKSLHSGEEGAPQYFSDAPLPPLEESDIVALTKVTRTRATSHWIINDHTSVKFDPAEHRPQSPGVQAIRLTPTRTASAVLSYLLDDISVRAGKMLRIEGPWHFSVWAKAEKPNTNLKVSFLRGKNSPPFFSENLPLTTDWQEYNIDFHGNDSGPAGPITLSLTADEVDSSVWVDDVWLAPQRQTPTNFRKEVVDVLRLINPSFIREFPHVADTWENRLADPFERKSWVLRLTSGQTEAVYSYSLPEFLQLCSLVGANPWIIIPPVFSDYELRQLGQYLAKEASVDRFSEIVLEFGNENWNWHFRPVAIPYYQAYGEAANRAFSLISTSAGNKVNIKYLVNGQYASPATSMKFLDNTPNADGITIAPYFFRSLQKGTPDLEAIKGLLNDDPGPLKDTADEIFIRDKALAVYELNLHTTQGDAKTYERDRVVAGAISGSALAKKVLECLFVGADPVIVNALAQHDSSTWEIDDLVKLWGVTRDFGPPPLLRPTGLALIMLNEVVGGSMHKIDFTAQTTQDNQKLPMAAFSHDSGWKAAIISESPKTLELELEFPNDGRQLPDSILILDAQTPFDTNEIGEKVTLSRKSLEVRERFVRFTIPPWGFVVLGETKQMRTSD